MILGLVSPGEHVVLVFLVELVAILVTARTLGWLAGRFGQPSVVGELVAGIVLGPSVLGHVAPDLFDWLFPDAADQGAMLYAVSWLGLLLLLASTGFESDISVLRRVGRPAIFVAVNTLVLPLVGGFLLGIALPDILHGPNAETVSFGAFMAVALSISSLPVVVRVLAELGMLRRDVSQTIVAVALTEDVVGWILLGVVAGLAEGGGVELDRLARTIGAVALFLVGAATIGRRVVDRALRAVASTDGPIEPATVVVLAIVLGSGALTHWLHVEAVLGAFVAGILIGRSRWRDERVLRLIESLSFAVLAPVFFATAGLRVDLGVFDDWTIVASTAAIVAMATLTKAGGAFIGSRMGHLPRREGYALMIALNARGALEIVVASVGLSIGVLDEASYGAIVMMAIVTTVAAPPLLRKVLAGWEGTPEEQARLAEEREARRRLVVGVRPPIVPSRGGPPSIAAASLVDLCWPKDTPVSIITVGADADIDVVRNVLAERRIDHHHRAGGREGDPVDAILAEAGRGHGAIVVGVTDRPGGPSLSPVADALVRRGSVPVVLIRGERMTGRRLPAAFGRAVVPVTGTVNSRAAQEIACQISASLGTELIFVHVESGVDLPGLYRGTHPLGQADPVLRDAVDNAERSGAGRVRTIARAGHGRDVATEIVRVAIEEDADVIVLGATRREIEDASFLGPNASRVLDVSPTTVIVVATPPGWSGWHS